MEDYTIKIEDEKTFLKIKSELDPKLYIECGRCGAVKFDAVDLAQAANKLLSSYYDSYNIQDEEISDILYEILFDVVEIEPEFDNYEEWVKWYKENRHRECNFTDGDGWPYYRLCNDAVLFCDKNCKCFNKLQEGKHSPEYKRVINEINNSKRPLTKPRLINKLSENLNISKKEANRFLNALNKIFIEEINRKGEFILPGVGKITKNQRRKKKGD